MQRLKIVNTTHQHVLVTADEPVTIEARVDDDGALLLYAYPSTEPNFDMDPVLVFDGHYAESMVDDIHA